MARRGNVRVSIQSEYDDKGQKQAERGIGRLDDAASKSFGKLKMGAIGAGAAAAGGLAIGLKTSADAAIEAEKSQARLVTQLRALGISYSDHAKHIDEVIKRQSQLAGLDDEDLADSFTNIVRVTGDVNEALRLNAIAADLARAKHIDVAKAGDIVGKVAGGNTGILARYGIVIEKGASSTEALGSLQRKFAGQAEAYGKTTAGAMDRAGVASENLGELVGTKLTPLLAKAATAFVNVVEGVQRSWPRITRTVEPVTSAVGSAVSAVRRVITRWVEANQENIQDFVRAVRRLGSVVKDIFENVLVPVVRRVLPIYRGVFGGIASALGNLVKTVVAIINGDWSKAWDSFKGVIRGVGKAAVTIIKGAGDAIGDAVVALGRLIVRGIVRGVRGLGSALKDAVVGGVKGALGAAGSAIDKISPFGDVTDAIAKKYPAATAGGGAAGPVGGQVAGLAPAARAGLSAIQSLFGGVRVSSGYRSPATNAAAGGAKNSDHLTGNALDLVPAAGWSPAGVALLDRIASWARRSPMVRWIGWRGVPGHGPGNHLHLSFNPMRGTGDPNGDPPMASAATAQARAATSRYGFTQLRRLWVQAGGDPAQSALMARIAQAESGGNPTARNPSGATGLWQILGQEVPGNLFDPVVNARNAVWKLQHQGLGAWAASRANWGRYEDESAPPLAAAPRRAATTPTRRVAPTPTRRLTPGEPKSAGRGRPQRTTGSQIIAPAPGSTEWNRQWMDVYKATHGGRTPDQDAARIEAANDAAADADTDTDSSAQDETNRLLEEQNRILQEQLDRQQAFVALLEERNQRDRRDLNVSQAQMGALGRVLADIVGGELGQRLGGRRSAVSAPGMLARY